jgi:uncharacterized RDD family membrane protein YckC
VTRDPTQVMTRRCFAFLIDGLVVVLLVAAAAFVTPSAVDVGDDCPDPVPSGDFCFDWEADAYEIDGGAFIIFVVVLGVLLTIVLLGSKRLTGASLGKTVFGIRVVDATGADPSAGRSVVRTLALGVDGLALVLPIGLWLALFTPGHRRVGDFLARTWVVRRDAVGTPPRDYPISTGRRRGPISKNVDTFSNS